MMNRLKTITKNQVGLTLIELMIALAITSIIAGTASIITFQVFNGEARANNHMDAINRVQNAGREMSRDAGMAQSVVLTDDDDGFPLTLTWTEWDTNETHNMVYEIYDNELRRAHYIGEIDGTPDDTYLFEYVIGAHPDNPTVPVTYCERDPDNNQLTFTLTAAVGAGSQQVSETRQYKTIPRPIMY